MNIQDITAIKTLSGFYFEITTEKRGKRPDARRDKSDRFLTSGQTLTEQDLNTCLTNFLVREYEKAKAAAAIWDNINLHEDMFNDRFTYYTGITLKGKPAKFDELKDMYLKAIDKAQFRQASLF